MVSFLLNESCSKEVLLKTTFVTVKRKKLRSNLQYTTKIESFKRNIGDL